MSTALTEHDAMSTERLYNLLPSIYRIRDHEHGEVLRALMGILESEYRLVEDDVAGLYDDWFIETAAEWVIPYIADLLGVRMMHTIESAETYSQRAFVANTLRYRRRKGTAAMLEDLAKDVTGWHAHVVAFFELLQWSQHLNHLRYDYAANGYSVSPQRLNPAAVNRVGTINLRSMDALDRLDGAFDEVAHTVDVRPPCGVRRNGRHNIRNVGFYLWRLQSYPLRGVVPCVSEAGSHCFHFNPLGAPTVLFNNPDGQDDDAAEVQEVHVPGPIRRVAFFERPQDYYGHASHLSLGVYAGTQARSETLVPPEDVICRDLSTWSPPPSGIVAIDVELGRLAFHPGEEPADVRVSYHYGFSGDIGGGPYDRRTRLIEATDDDFHATVGRDVAADFTSVAAALGAWDPATHARALVSVLDSATYAEQLTLALSDQQHVVLQAANERRPLLRLTDADGALSSLKMEGGSGSKAEVTLSGVVMEGFIEIAPNSLGICKLVDCTLVPGRALDENGDPAFPGGPSIDVAEKNDDLEVMVDRCITGALRMPEDMECLTVRDSIVGSPRLDGDLVPAPPTAPDPGNRLPAIAFGLTDDAPGTRSILERSTFFGEVFVKSLPLATEVLFTQRAHALRRQEGCVRYSYVPAGSVVPRRFRCEPDLAFDEAAHELGTTPASLPAAEREQIRNRLRPEFTSERFGDPAFGQLGPLTDDRIRTSAENGAEVGAFNHLMQAHREANLLMRLEEYLPYGLEACIIHVT